MVIFHGYVSHNQRVYTNPDGNTSAQCNHGRIKGSTSNAPPLRARLPGLTLLFLWLVLPNSNMFHIVSHNWWENVQETHTYIYIYTYSKKHGFRWRFFLKHPLGMFQPIPPVAPLRRVLLDRIRGQTSPQKPATCPHVYYLHTHTQSQTQMYIYIWLYIISN